MRMVKQLLIAFIIMLLSTMGYSARIKDIAGIAGVRANQLVGYGLVVGLDGTGDQSSQAPFTNQSFQNMLVQFGLRMPSGQSAQLKNVAAVAISAALPPFARIGEKIDIIVSSVGNATSLRGGSLLMSPLKGADGKVYAIAQGNVVVSGFGTQGADGSKVTVNTLSTGSIPGGASVENTVDTPFVDHGKITLELMMPDFTTAERMMLAINKDFGFQLAKAQDARVVTINVPESHSYSGSPGHTGSPGYKAEPNLSSDGENPVDSSKYVPLISRIENIEIDPAEPAAKVVVNSRTGTIVIGRNVTVDPVAVSHGNLSVIVTERPYVSQPNALSKGKTVTGTASDITIAQSGRAFVFAPGPSLNDLVELINSVGAAPGDLISILEAIKGSGSLNAELEVI